MIKLISHIHPKESVSPEVRKGGYNRLILSFILVLDSLVVRAPARKARGLGSSPGPG